MEQSQTQIPKAQPLSPGALQSVVRKFPKFEVKGTLILIGLVLVIIFAGIGTGWLASGRKGSLLGSRTQSVPGAKTSATEAGLADEKTFKDSAQGELKEGGIAGEGTHHLVRPGGDSQNVYLTSTVIDLQSFVGKKVQIWGQTISARQAGWLMDVGKVKVIQ